MGSHVKLTGPVDIVGTNSTVSNGTVITTTFDLTGAIPGLRTVVITNPDNTSVTLPLAFTVEEGGVPQIWVDIVGRDKIRIGREQTYYVVVGNSGNVRHLRCVSWSSESAAGRWNLCQGAYRRAHTSNDG